MRFEIGKVVTVFGVRLRIETVDVSLRLLVARAVGAEMPTILNFRDVDGWLDRKGATQVV